RPFEDPERAREAGRRGGHAKAAKMRAARGHVEPLGGTILELAERLGVLGEPSWGPWRVFLKVLFALPLDAAERAVLRECTGREAPLALAVPEAWVIVGRRGGKSRVAALVAVFLAACRDYRTVLAPGERGRVMVLAADKEQAGVILDYVKALFGHPLVGAVKALFGRPSLAPLVARRLRDAVELKTGISIEVHASSYKGVRGYTVVGAVLDEVAFWPRD